MSLTLRPYQSAMIEAIRAHLRAGRKSVLATTATGAGKTVLSAHMIATAVGKGKRAWFTVHRQELLRQSVETLTESANLNVGVIAAGWGANGYHAAQVATIQTLMRRWQKYAVPDLLVVDECHHVASKSWSELIKALRAKNPALVVIGLTATPTRLDGRGLGEHFEVIVEGPSTARLISDKYLAPYRLFAPSTVDLSKVHTVAGDYSKHELDDAMRGSRVVGDAVKEYKEKCNGKRALMFLWSIRASEQMAEALNAAGIPAVHIDGMTDDPSRVRAVQAFRDGRVKVMTNVDIVTEGFDLSAIEACFLLRPTQSLGLYLQMVGRALRTFPGKDYALIFDHAGLVFKHGLPDDPREWSLGGIDKSAAKKQEVQIRQCGRCYAVMPVQARRCIECGFEFPVQYREVEQEDGELKEIDPAVIRARLKQEQASAKDYDALVQIERQRGYKPGWAQHILAARGRKQYA